MESKKELAEQYVSNTDGNVYDYITFIEGYEAGEKASTWNDVNKILPNDDRESKRTNETI